MWKKIDFLGSIGEGLEDDDEASVSESIGDDVDQGDEEDLSHVVQEQIIK